MQHLTPEQLAALQQLHEQLSEHLRKASTLTPQYATDPIRLDTRNAAREKDERDN